MAISFQEWTNRRDDLVSMKFKTCALTCQFHRTQFFSFLLNRDRNMLIMQLPLILLFAQDHAEAAPLQRKISLHRRIGNPDITIYKSHIIIDLNGDLLPFNAHTIVAHIWAILLPCSLISLDPFQLGANINQTDIWSAKLTNFAEFK